ncbi:MAG TPA: sigma-70 family RNA polymerase sigma factor [Myxococcota bacterium]|nr:sigma-70 family RNA polymerase sigma factor [Myxococcota bacterium]
MEQQAQARAVAASRGANRAGAARQQALVAEHLPQVRGIVQRLGARLPSHLDREELIHGGVLGLIDAARRFDPKLGCSFASYAEIRIRGAVLDQLRAMDWVPRTVRERRRHLESAEREIEGREGRRAEPAEVAELMGLAPERFERLRWLLFEAPWHPSAEPWDEAAYAEGHAHASDPFQLLGRGRAEGAVARALAGLPAKERAVVSLLYWEELSLDAAGRTLGVSESRIRALHLRALLRLRHRLRALHE